MCVEWQGQGHADQLFQHYHKVQQDNQWFYCKTITAHRDPHSAEKMV
jgi:hypothetical protein